MRLLEFQKSEVAMRDLINALSQYFDLERVGGKSRIYDVGNRSGVIFLLNNSLKGLGLIWSKGNTRVDSVAIWNKIDFDKQPDIVADIPSGSLTDIIPALVSFIRNPALGVSESLRENATVDEFRSAAKQIFGDKAKHLSLNDLRDIEDQKDVIIPAELRHNSPFQIDSQHWNLWDNPTNVRAVAAATGGTAGKLDPSDPQYDELSRFKTVKKLHHSGAIVIVGRKPNGEIFEIPGLDTVMAQIERMIGKNMDDMSQSGGGSSMEEQYKLLEDKIKLVAGDQSDFIKSLLITGMPSAGKCISLDTKIPTRDGWTTMGDIKLGDILFDEMGNQCAVSYVAPIYYGKPCNKITFDDGTMIIADDDHRWLTTTDASRRSKTISDRRGTTLKPRGTNQQNKREFPSVKTTKNIRETLRVRGGKLNHQISTTNGINLPQTNLPVPAWILGFWLGDGSKSNSQITVGRQDFDNIREILDGYSEPYSMSYRDERSLWVLNLTQGQKGSHSTRMITRLRNLNVLNKKHIPLSYKRASFHDRLEILRGLMDSDGHIDKLGRCEISLSDELLARDVKELICSLGIKVGWRVGRTFFKGVEKKNRYRMFFSTSLPIFKLDRKARLVPVKQPRGSDSRSIVSVEPVPTVPVRCITVDSPNHLFLCSESFIPTHNTFRVMSTVKEMGLESGRDYITKKGKISAKSLYRVLIQQLNGLAIFDDCDSVVRDVDGVNMLKGALDTDAIRTVDYDVQGLMNTDAMPFARRAEIVGAMSAILRGVPTEDELSVIEKLMTNKQDAKAAKTQKPMSDEERSIAAYSRLWDDDDDDDSAPQGGVTPERIREAETFVMNNLPNKIDFMGRVIFISNMSEEEWGSVGDGAIINRAFHQNMAFADNEMLDYIGGIKEHIKARMTEDQKQEVLDYLRELWQAGKITKPVNFRLVQQCFDLYKMNDWKSLIANIG